MRHMGQRSSDTTIGGARRQFPTTIWSDLLIAADDASPISQERLNQLFKLYWKPVYAFIRTSWRKSVEDSKDLTQAFFAHLVEKRFLVRASSVRSSFRAYLKQALRYFIIDQERGAASRRPPSPLFIFSLDASPAELERLDPVSPEESPERLYDRNWFRCLMDGALETLETNLKAQGKPAYWEVFRSYFVHLRSSSSMPHPGLAEDPGSASPTYRDLAARLGIPNTDIRNYLTCCRGMLRRILMERIREYVDTDREAELELQTLLIG